MATIRPRSARAPFQIHHDEVPEEELEDEDLDTMEESREYAEEGDEENYSDASDESDELVDHSVQEDMARFQETFKGIKERFRLINRIGEGKSIYFSVSTL
jgi:cell division control protein 7